MSVRGTDELPKYEQHQLTDTPGIKSFQSYETSASETFEGDLKDKPARGKFCPSEEEGRELRPSLHSHKEQKRRLQIRKSCQRLCDLLPFVNCQLDTATTLELTARLIEQLRKMWVVCGKTHRNHRKNVRLKRNTSQQAKPAAKETKTEVSDHLSRRCTQQKSCKKENLLSITITNCQTMDQMLPTAEGLTTANPPPILLDKSSVPRGQMLPVCQDQCLSSSFQSPENNWINPTSAFMNPTSCGFPFEMISCSLPQTGLDPSSSHVLWDVPPGLANPVALSSATFGPAYNPPEQTPVTNFILPPGDQSQIDSPLVALTDSVSVDLTSQSLVPLSVSQSGTSSSDDLTAENGNQPVPDALCDSRLLQESELYSSPVTDSPQDGDSPFWLDLLLDINSNLSFPDANLINTVLSPYKGSD